VKNTTAGLVLLARFCLKVPPAELSDGRKAGGGSGRSVGFVGHLDKKGDGGCV